MTDLVITLIGPDRPGLVEAVAATVAEHGGNWLEGRMAHLAGKFAGVLRVSAPPETAGALTLALGRLEAGGLRIVTESGSPKPAPVGRAMEVELVGLDRPGLVREISRLLAGRRSLVFRLALEVVTRAAPPLVLSLKRYADMPIASRVRALERLEKSPLSIMLFAVKTLLCFHWFEHPDSAAEAGLLPNVTALGSYRRPATRSPRPTTQR
jgi:glycine cleavage system regulatory protein